MFVALKKGEEGLFLPLARVACAEHQLTFEGTFVVPFFVSPACLQHLTP